MIFAFKIFISELWLIFYANWRGYYKHIDKLPVYNWFKLSEGDYSYLYKKKRLKRCPEFFRALHMELWFQMEQIDPSYIRKLHKHAYLKSLYATTKNPRWINSANFLKAELESEKKVMQELPKLNDMLNIIEETFNNIGQIDVYKMSTSRFFSLLNKAIDKNKKHGNIK